MEDKHLEATHLCKWCESAVKTNGRWRYVDKEIYKEIEIANTPVSHGICDTCAIEERVKLRTWKVDHGEL